MEEKKKKKKNKNEDIFFSISITKASFTHCFCCYFMVVSFTYFAIELDAKQQQKRSLTLLDFIRDSFIKELVVVTSSIKKKVLPNFNNNFKNQLFIYLLFTVLILIFSLIRAWILIFNEIIFVVNYVDLTILLLLLILTLVNY